MGKSQQGHQGFSKVALIGSKPPTPE